MTWPTKKFTIYKIKMEIHKYQMQSIDRSWWLKILQRWLKFLQKHFFDEHAETLFSHLQCNLTLQGLLIMYCYHLISIHSVNTYCQLSLVDCTDKYNCHFIKHLRLRDPKTPYCWLTNPLRKIPPHLHSGVWVTVFKGYKNVSNLFHWNQQLNI